MSLAPIILFVYNRPQHTATALEALANNPLAKDSTLYIYADGAKADASAETLQKIKETREVIKSKTWCKEVIIVEREKNYGLANNILNGVTEIINKHGKIIALEDDLVTAPHFLNYMNDALNQFENKTEVACISAYVYPIANLPELFFIKGADCWGWATWKRVWDNFETDGTTLIQQLESQQLTKAFDFNGTYPYTGMLRDQIAGKNNSWAVRWYASAFLKNKLCLYPAQSLVNNIGTDGSGTHFSSSTTTFETVLSQKAINVTALDAKENAKARQQFENYFASLKAFGPSTGDKLKAAIKQLVPAFLLKLYRKLKA